MEPIEEFGKYRLIRPLAQGGMAQLFLAKHVGPGGFEKTVAVKRVLPHLAEDSDLINMFLDEARLASRLNHPNVVQVFDFGEAEGTYYLAMEYLEGSDVSSLLRSVKKLGQVMPAQLAAIIASEAAAGLHHAHTLLGDDGSAYNIVHRDVSPSNIFVTRSGTVKVLDFGIARAEGRLVRTQTGILKGKAPYMPPEQLNGETLDARADVYALGCTLHEMLTGARLFKRDTEASTLMAILREPVLPPRELRADVPEPLSEVAMVAIERDREKRYGSALEMRDALEDYLSSCSYAPVQRLLSHFLDSLEKGQVPRGTEGARRPSTDSVRRQSAELATPSGSLRKPGTGSNAGLVPVEEPRKPSTGSNAKLETRRAPTGSIPKVAPEETRRAPTGSIPKVAPEEPRRAPTGSIPKVAPEETRRASTGGPRRSPSAPQLLASDGEEEPASETTRFKVVGPLVEQLQREEEVLEQETASLPAARPPRPPPQPPPTHSKALLGGFAGVALVAAVAAVLVLRNGDEENVRPLATVGSAKRGDGSKQMERAAGALPPIEVRPVETSVADRPGDAVALLDPVGSGEPSPSGGRPVDLKPSDLRAADPKPEVQPEAKAVDAKPVDAKAEGKPVDAKPVEAPVDAKPQTGSLNVNCVPWCKVFIDGRDLKRSSPALGIVLPAGRHALKVVNPDTGLEMERSVTIRAGATAQEVIKF